MAAPQWTGTNAKAKSAQTAKALFRHNDMDRRMEARHTNPHIDKSKTHLNFSYRGLDYARLCAAYDARMGEIEQGRQSSGKNARTVLQSVIIYPPAGITDKDTLRRWFMRAGDVLDERFGKNFLEMQVDFDECHEYRNEAGELVMSREHGHARLVPEVDGKLNGKKFSSRAAINGLNAALQEMSVREFGTPMMDGSKAKGGQTVEHLKAESRGREIIAKAEEKAEQEADMIRGKAHVDAVLISGEAAQWVKRHTEGAEARIKAAEDAAAAKGRQEAAELLKATQDALEAAQGHLEACKQFRLDAQQREQLRQLQEEQQRRQEAIEAAKAKAGEISGRSTSSPTRQLD